MKEYQADIKRRYPLGVPWNTPYEDFCQHYYNFDVIAQDYGLKQEAANNQSIKRRTSKPTMTFKKVLTNYF
jgi:hypothetical protein